jgi:hypothetical protein
VPKITPSVDSYLLQHSRDAGQEPAGAAPAGGPAPAGSQTAGSSYWSRLVAPVLLDPRRPGTAQRGQLAEPVRPITGTTAGPGPVASATVSPAPAVSASASPVASPGSATHDYSPHSHPASRSAK